MNHFYVRDEESAKRCRASRDSRNDHGFGRRYDGRKGKGLHGDRSVGRRLRTQLRTGATMANHAQFKSSRRHFQNRPQGVETGQYSVTGPTILQHHKLGSGRAIDNLSREARPRHGPASHPLMGQARPQGGPRVGVPHQRLSALHPLALRGTVERRRGAVPPAQTHARRTTTPQRMIELNAAQDGGRTDASQAPVFRARPRRSLRRTRSSIPSIRSASSSASPRARARTCRRAPSRSSSPPT